MDEQFFFLEYISDSILIQNDVGEIFFANNKGITTLGFEDSKTALQFLNSNDAFNNTLQKFILPDSVLADSSTLDLNQFTDVYDLYLVMANGETELFNFNTKMLNWNGAIVYFSSFKQVPVDKKEDQESTLNKKLIFEILNMLPCAVTVTDFGKGRYLYVNDYMASLFGYKKEEVVGKTALDLNIWVDLHDRESILLELKKMGAVYDHRPFFRDKNGLQIPTSFSAHIIQSQDQPLLVAATFNRTEELEKENALRMSFEKLAEAEQKANQAAMFLTAVLNNIGQGVIVVDHNLNVVDWNETYLKILRYPKGLIKKGVNIREILLRDARVGLFGTGDVVALVQERVERLKVAIQSKEFELDWSLADGSVVELSGRAVADGSFVVTAEDITERRKQANKIYKEAYSDSLTGIANRRAFDIELPEAQQNARRNKTGVILGLLDLDDFKNVNDIHGHAIGDAVLIEAALIIKNSIRDTDLAVRMGGDEFAVIFNDTLDKNIAYERLQNIIKKIIDLTMVGGFSIDIGASAGMCLSELGELNCKDLFIKADEALYLAKKQGKGCVKMEVEAIYTPDKSTHY
jgi:diguanylate cyclase (GGDEF)-like protein/PAS domain S-box-containing protein